MGKHKERLNSHNIDLSAILAGIQNLPPAGGEDLQPTAEAQNTAVTELLKMVNRKVADHKGEGEYVWKKSRKWESVDLGEELTGDNGYIITSGYSANSYTIQYSDEVELVDGKVTLVSPNSVSLSYKGGVAPAEVLRGKYVVTYRQNASSQLLFVPENTVFSTVYANNGIKALPSYEVLDISEKEEFIDYVVSSDAEAYPDGALHADGYWYELVKEGVSAEDFGVSKIAVSQFTLSSKTATGSLKMTHDLGEEPTLLIISALENPSNGSNYCVLHFFANKNVEANTATTTNIGAIITYSQYNAVNGYAVTEDKVTMGADSISLGSYTSTSAYFTNGIPYMMLVGA